MSVSNIFLCHALEDKDIAEPIQLALVNAGYKVFYDDVSLPAGVDHHDQIYKAIFQSDLFIFIASKSSLEQGKYTLTELKFAREHWPAPVNNVIVVNPMNLPASELPPYLTSTTLLSIKGNSAAEVVARVNSLALSRKNVIRSGKAILLGSIIFGSAIFASVKFYPPLGNYLQRIVARFTTTDIDNLRFTIKTNPGFGVRGTMAGLVNIDHPFLNVSTDESVFSSRPLVSDHITSFRIGLATTLVDGTGFSSQAWGVSQPVDKVIEKDASITIEPYATKISIDSVDSLSGHWLVLEIKLEEDGKVFTTYGHSEKEIFSKSM